MPAITLELLTPSSTGYQDQQFISADLHAFIQKPIEYFRYLDKVGDGAIKLDHILNQSINSHDTLHFYDTSNLVTSNAPHVYGLKSPMKVINGNSVTLNSNKALITNKLVKNESGVMEPVWYKIVLPEGLNSVTVQQLKQGNMVRNPKGFYIDLDNNCIWSNKTNQYDIVSGDYEIYFIVGTTSTESIREIATFVPVVTEATWEDIDQDTGALKEDSNVFVTEEIGNTTTLYFNKTDIWYIKQLPGSVIKLQKPLGYYSDENWFVTITNGKISNSKFNNIYYYSIPEFNYQNYLPYKPYKYSFYKNLYIINNNIIKIQESEILVDTAHSINLNIFVYNAEDTLLKVLTTNESLHDTYYSDTLIKYEYGRITSISKNGYILLDYILDSSYQVYAEYFYKSEELEFTKINLNPILNRAIESKVVVFYIIPNVTSTEEAIQYLVLDETGIVIECSQTANISYPNFKLKNTDGSYNANTVIGKPYYDSTNGFLQRYTLNYANDYGYFVLGLVGISISDNKENYLITDVHNIAGFNEQDTVFAKNPKIKTSLAFEENAMKELPMKSTMVVELPMSLLQEYGGKFSIADAERLATKYVPTGLLPIIEWIYASSNITFNEVTTNSISINIVSDYTTNIYQLIDNIWTLIDTVDGDYLFVSNDLDYNTVYYYQFKAVENGIEYPAKYTFEARTRNVT